MKLDFFKYQGAGNDFVIIDNREHQFQLNTQDDIIKLCDRRFGIGADGLILLENEIGYDFKMVYFNSDGNESSMCGNGGRCILVFANKLGIIENKGSFLAIDGEHIGEILPSGEVTLKMNDVDHVAMINGHYELNTGSPHYVQFTTAIDKVDIEIEGKSIRFSEPYKKDGINVNFAEIMDAGQMEILTYERGVEAETLACGTGVTACAIASYFQIEKETPGVYTRIIKTKGGDKLSVKFSTDGFRFYNIWLTGPAKLVFKGEVYI